MFVRLSLFTIRLSFLPDENSYVHVHINYERVYYASNISKYNIKESFHLWCKIITLKKSYKHASYNRCWEKQGSYRTKFNVTELLRIIKKHFGIMQQKTQQFVAAKHKGHSPGLVSKQSHLGRRAVSTARHWTWESRQIQTGVSGAQMFLKQSVTTSDVHTAFDTAWHTGPSMLAQSMSRQMIGSCCPVGTLGTLEYRYTAGVKLEMLLHMTFTFWHEWTLGTEELVWPQLLILATLQPRSAVVQRRGWQVL